MPSDPKFLSIDFFIVHHFLYYPSIKNFATKVTLGPSDFEENLRIQEEKLKKES